MASARAWSDNQSQEAPVWPLHPSSNRLSPPPSAGPQRWRGCPRMLVSGSTRARIATRFSVPRLAIAVCSVPTAPSRAHLSSFKARRAAPVAAGVNPVLAVLPIRSRCNLDPDFIPAQKPKLERRIEPCEYRFSGSPYPILLQGRAEPGKLSLVVRLRP